METGKALILAQEKGLDLVEINPTNRPPICKIMDFGKHKYDLSKKQKEQKSRQKEIELKEVRLTLKISDHDLSYKARQAREFYDKGDKVRVSLRLRGRENVFYTQAFLVFEKFSDYAGLEFERYPQKGGNMITATVSKIKAKEDDAKIKDSQSNNQKS
jgi:translation initiation factor IF-3